MKGHVHKRGNTWTVIYDEPRLADGRRRQRQKGGFASKKDAQTYLTGVLNALNTNTYQRPEQITVKAYLEEVWLPGLDVRPSTLRSYTSHVSTYLTPEIGHLRLTERRGSHLKALYAKLLRIGKRKPLSPSTVTRIHATIRAALAEAVRDEILQRNPASNIRVPGGTKYRPDVWTLEQVRTFLRGIDGDRLAPMYRFLIATGTRRGEAVGLRWQDVNLEEGHALICRQIVDNGGELVAGPPKTSRGYRTIALDSDTVTSLKKWHAQQAQEKLTWGPAYEDQDLVFARENGHPQRPEYVTRHFQDLAESLELPRIRLHDLRHANASLLLQQGVAMKVVSERLGHSSITLTADTYSHVSRAVDQETAEALGAALDPEARARIQA